MFWFVSVLWIRKRAYTLIYLENSLPNLVVNKTCTCPRRSTMGLFGRDPFIRTVVKSIVMDLNSSIKWLYFDYFCNILIPTGIHYIQTTTSLCFAFGCKQISVWCVQDKSKNTQKFAPKNLSRKKKCQNKGTRPHKTQQAI